RPDIVGRTLLIGGGPACRVRQRELMSRALGAVGVGMLPDEAFTTSPFHTDWLDTEDSQSLLDYQRHDLDDLIADMTRSVGWRRAPARLLAPVIRRALVRRSPYPARR
ncbi:MAG: NAD(P)-dependent oxidoreductase, partial [Actinomycetota bacterium]